jgi:hypothetical protein
VCGEISIEGHAHVAHEQTAARRHGERLVVHRQQAVGDRAAGRGELRELRCEVSFEVDAEPRFHRLSRQVKVAHQLGNHVPPEAIVVAQRVAAFDRELSVVDRLVVAGECLVVLRERTAHVADGRDADGNAVRRRPRGVAHEAAVQPALARRHGQLVAGQGEVVHADRHVAGAVEGVDGGSEQLAFRVRVRQIERIDRLLVRPQPRHVRVGVDGDAVRQHGGDRLQRPPERLDRLARQAVDEIEIDRIESRPPRELVERARAGFRLMPLDRVLHALGEVLDAERQPVESETAEQRDLLAGGHARVHFDRAFGIRGDVEVPPDRGVEARNLLQGEVGRRPAAPVVLDDTAASGQGRGQHADFAREIFEIGLRDVALLRGDHGAAAIGAALGAERNVDVERERIAGDRRRGGQPVAVALRVEALVKLHRGGVRRIAGPGPVVSPDQRVEVRRFDCG